MYIFRLIVFITQIVLHGVKVDIYIKQNWKRRLLNTICTIISFGRVKILDQVKLFPTISEISEVDISYTLKILNNSFLNPNPICPAALLADIQAGLVSFHNPNEIKKMLKACLAHKDLIIPLTCQQITHSKNGVCINTNKHNNSMFSYDIHNQLSPFMEHIHIALSLDARFDLHNKQQLEAFRIWFKRNSSSFCIDKISISSTPDTEDKNLHLLKVIDPIAVTYLALLKGKKLSKPHESLINYFKMPIDKSNSLTQFGLMLAICSRMPIKITANDPFPTKKILMRLNEILELAFPELLPLISNLPNAEIVPRITIIGPTKASDGLSENVKMSRQALDEISLTYYHSHHLNAVNISKTTNEITPRRSVALFHINADKIPQAMMSYKYLSEDCYKIGYLLWEFEKLPKAHKLALKLLDEIWVPTKFVQEAYQKETDKPVILMGKSINLPTVHPTCLSQYGSNPNAFTFLCAFDAQSSVERKNPLATVLGFLHAFPYSHYQDVQLIIKTTPINTGHWGDPNHQLETIRSIAKPDPRIIIIEEHIPFQKLLELIKTADCLVSTHRTEGFGYLPAYAMALGTPTICTDYGGNRDFCTKNTTFLLPLKMVDVPNGHSIYPLEGAKWADISVDDVATQMRESYKKPHISKQKATKASQTILNLYHPSLLAQKYENRLTEIGCLNKAQMIEKIAV